MALVLAALGIYGLLTQQVIRRTLEIGIRILDAEHRKLATMIGMLGSDLAAGEDVRRVRASFEKLIAFTEVHFATEEALMDRYVIEDRIAHKQEHRKLLQDARSLAASLDESNMMLTMSSLNEWLLRHVDSADKELARQMQARGYADASRKPPPSLRRQSAAASR